MTGSNPELASLLDGAADAVTRKNWDVVRVLTARALELDPGNAEATGLRAFAARHLGGVSGVVPEDAERRFLTVAFIDMVGSTEISSQLDPEDYRDALEFYQGEVRAAAGAYDGHVAKLLGDGAIVYFGYPIAHEDAPRRACLAGLEIVRRID
ncbi:MAG: adenylate/guanylate cyclase domain-containing protein, partial [Actinomycetota bacterium]|nr:adenylate/guanylate cyclase domain-containing protein [Actinomycetota bacterium]